MATIKASGKLARATCDRCGFEYGHNELRLERAIDSQLYVCLNCYDSIPSTLRWRGPIARIGMRWTRPKQ